METTISEEKKNTLDGIKNPLDTIGKKISELENTVIKLK